MKVLRPIQVNVGTIARVQKRLRKHLLVLHREVLSWVRDNALDGLAADAVPFDVLQKFGRAKRGWLKRWADFAEWFCEDAIHRVESTTDAGLLAAFRDAGFTVKFDSGRILDDIVQGLIVDSATLIKSLGESHVDSVAEIVTESYMRGKSYRYAEEQIQSRFGVTERRANLIARDQMDKASQAIQRTRDAQLGITEGIWVHLPGVKSSRETHVAMNGQRFRLDEGLFDSEVGQNVIPGELPMCRCTYRRVIPEFGD